MMNGASLGRESSFVLHTHKPFTHTCCGKRRRTLSEAENKRKRLKIEICNCIRQDQNKVFLHMIGNTWGKRHKRQVSEFSPSLMPPTGDAPLIAGPGGESGVSASGRNDALAWTVAPRRGRESGGLGGFWLPCFEGKFGRGRKSRFEFLLSAAPILI